MNRSTSEKSPNAPSQERLRLPERYASTVAPDRVHPSISRARLQVLANAALDPNPLRFRRAAQRMLSQCRDAEQFLEEAVSGTAMALGTWCDDSQISVEAVSVATERLEELVFEIADEYLSRSAAGSTARSILLTRAPGNQHTLGSFIAAELFNWHGWSVISGPGIEGDRVIQTLASERIDVLGVTVSEDRDLLPAHRLISHGRAVSRNPALIVVVGGTQAFLRQDLAREVNADLVATHVSRARIDLLRMLRARQGAQASR